MRETNLVIIAERRFHLLNIVSAFLCLLWYDLHDVNDTIFKAYDGLRLVTTFRGRDRFFDILGDGFSVCFYIYAAPLSLWPVPFS